MRNWTMGTPYDEHSRILWRKMLLRNRTGWKQILLWWLIMCSFNWNSLLHCHLLYHVSLRSPFCFFYAVICCVLLCDVMFRSDQLEWNFMSEFSLFSKMACLMFFLYWRVNFLSSKGSINVKFEWRSWIVKFWHELKVERWKMFRDI